MKAKIQLTTPQDVVVSIYHLKYQALITNRRMSILMAAYRELG